jgi:hypothetical protein
MKSLKPDCEVRHRQKTVAAPQQDAVITADLQRLVGNSDCVESADAENGRI